MPSLVIQYAPDSDRPAAGSEDTWLRMEQDLSGFPPEVATATLSDVLSMYRMAASGLPAATYRRPSCPVSFDDASTAEVRLPFFVWPSGLDLPYSLDPGLGASVTAAERVAVRREFDLVVGLADAVSIGCLFDGTATWQTPCIDRYGREVAAPLPVIEDGVVRFDRAVFGVLRMAGDAVGYRHEYVIRIKAADAARITNLHPSVIASWVSDDGKTATETIDLEVPQCVEDALRTCPGDGVFEIFGSIVTPDEPVPVIYYSSCSGQVLEVRYEYD